VPTELDRNVRAPGELVELRAAIQRMLRHKRLPASAVISGSGVSLSVKSSSSADPATESDAVHQWMSVVREPFIVSPS
jgi:hypothetical protein